MTHFFSPPPNIASGATGTPTFDDTDDANRKFCDGGILLAAISDRICPMCGAGPDDECGYQPGLLAII